MNEMCQKCKIAPFEMWNFHRFVAFFVKDLFGLFGENDKYFQHYSNSSMKRNCQYIKLCLLCTLDNNNKNNIMSHPSISMYSQVSYPGDS